MTLVGLEGEVLRDVVMRATYGFEGGDRYESEVTVRPHSGDVCKRPRPISVRKQAGWFRKIVLADAR